MDRWKGIVRPYTQADVDKIKGKTRIEYTLARLGAERLWQLMCSTPYVNALGAQTGNQAVQQVKGGLNAIYCSGWQTAADANTGGQTYPDQSLYPVDSVPTLVKRINKALLRAEQIDVAEGKDDTHWMVPIVADAEAGFGGNLNAYELMRSMIEAGAAAVHFEDQLASEKKCGHLGGKVLVPTSQFIRTLIAARLAADACDVPTIIIARTDALSAQLITSDVDPADRPFISEARTPEGFYRLKQFSEEHDMERTIARGLAYAPYADMLWFETSEPNIEQARQFADAIHAQHPGKLLAYNCSPSFNWKKKLNAVQIGKFQEQLGEMGYAFQFITLAGFHSISLSMFKLAHMYSLCGMTAYADLQDEEFRQEENGYTATRHQREVGTGYFDAISQIISSGQSSTLALEGSTEQEQFKDEDREHQGF